MRFFNTAGPVDPEFHYCLPPLSRWDTAEILSLIGQRKYFVLHAPRQTGKTSCLLALREHLHHVGEYRALYANVESAQTAREDVAEAMRAILGEIGDRAYYTLGDRQVLDGMDAALKRYGPHGALRGSLGQWAASSSQPIVLMLDEVDSLVGDTLISLLRQLRSGYDRRGTHFPHSVILCGVRDVRDYRIHSSMDRAVITGGSAFNVRAESLRLGDLSQADIECLYQQHTQETGQPFEPAVFDAVWELTRGQPWLVNALGYEVTHTMKENRDRGRAITVEMIHAARESLILRRETHLDQLADKLQEDRVRRVLEPLLQGDSLESASPDDVQYVEDLGLIRATQAGPVIANAIYREIIPRELTAVTQLNLQSTYLSAWYVETATGRLDMHRLLTAFQEFFREHSEHWVDRFQYKEAGPQLLLQAFLQRIVNGGGRIEREYGLGAGRTDLLILWPLQGALSDPAVPRQKVVLELKLIRGSVDATIRDGLPQIGSYMDRCGAAEGHLVLFDRDRAKPWESKLFRRTQPWAGHTISIWGM